MSVVDECDKSIRRASDLGRKIRAPQGQLLSLEGIVSRLSLLLNIQETGNNPVTQTLGKIFCYLDTVVAELCKFTVAVKNAVVLNGPNS